MACMFNTMASIFASLNTFPVEAGIIQRWAPAAAWLAEAQPSCGGMAAMLVGDLLAVGRCLQDQLGTPHPTPSTVHCRERTSKSYHVSPYYLARFLCDLPLRLGQSLLFGECPRA